MGFTNATRACILAVCVHWYPHLIFPTTISNKSFTPTGINMEILKTTAKKYHLCYQTTPASGFGILLKNGTFTGAMGVLQRKEADLFITPAAISFDRYQVADYGVISDVDSFSLLYPYPTAEPDIGGFLKPFSLESWLAILFTSVAVIGLLWALFKVIVFLQPRNFKKERLVNKEVHKAFLWVLPQLVSQQTPLEARVTSVRVAVIFWILMAFIITTIYKSNLVALLTTSNVGVPFEKIEDTLNVPGLRVNVPLSSIFQDMYMNAEEGSFLNKFSKIATLVDYSSNNENHLPYRLPVTKGVPPRVGAQSSHLGFVNYGFSTYGHCTLTIAQEKFIPVYIGITFPKGSCLKRKFDRVSSALIEAGIVNYLMKSYLPNATFCYLRKGEQSVNTVLRSLSLKDFYGVFTILGAGVALAFCSFLLEVAIPPKNHRKPLIGLKRKQHYLK